MYTESELIITDENRIYHLDIAPGDLAEKIILVGDQERVPKVSKFFDTIEVKRSKREFVSHTGTYKGERISCVSTGIGTDNIDIVLNEIDATFNIDFESRTDKKKHTALEFVRIGTCGTLQSDIDPGAIIASKYVLGFDGLLNFYEGKSDVYPALTEAFIEQTNWHQSFNRPYLSKTSERMLQKIGFDAIQGITCTANGFYAPQGRLLRVKNKVRDLNERLSQFEFEGQRITNFEMETSGLYGMSEILGHEALTMCLVLANRVNKTFLDNYAEEMDQLILRVLDRFVG